ncbi:MAG TPA: hypothetical protein DIU35_09575 [Candidatus Latescibacteria bacterium]|nr:hypothetical protein [Gemmatimonadota bacterium]MBB31790.1 hypothetical protein [Gemmatimonadota bacterium]HCR17722.1 hypothetical protein [Candidatus Latescibacterota bacterium]
MRYFIILSLLLTLPMTSAYAQAQVPALLQQTGSAAESSPKSAKLAFIFSLVLPGVGEFYIRYTKRGAAFLGVEALTWINYARWRGKGNDLKAEFRKYADQNWNEARYRSWQEYNAANGRPYNETETLPCKHDTGDCEKVDTQQYYEMIGKYDQFVFGWDDVSNVGFSVINNEVSSGLREDYENQRNESNKLLKRASFIIGLAVANRIVSAVHASTRASRMAVQLSPFNRSGQPGLNLKLTGQF